MAPTPPEAPKAQSKVDILKGIFDDAVKAIKSAIGERQEIDPSKDLVALDENAKEAFEMPKVSFEKKFELGDYQITPDEHPAIGDNKVYLLLGSVDRATFSTVAKREGRKIERDGAKINWYQALQQDAELFLKLIEF